MFTEKHLLVLAKKVFGLRYPGFVFESNVRFPHTITNRIALAGSCGDAFGISRKIFINLEMEDELVEAEIDTHILLRKDLTKHGYASPSDYYWVVNWGGFSPAVAERAKQNNIFLRDRTWLVQQAETFRQKSREMRALLGTLESAGAWKAD